MTHFISCFLTMKHIFRTESMPCFCATTGLLFLFLTSSKVCSPHRAWSPMQTQTDGDIIGLNECSPLSGSTGTTHPPLLPVPVRWPSPTLDMMNRVSVVVHVKSGDLVAEMLTQLLA